jgi:pyridoxamine 5'-phosphate oxidase-like protein
VRERLPTDAREVLERGTLCHLAVRTSLGPHLTPVVYVLDGGRIWLTTSRASVKARALRRDRDVAGMIRAGAEVVTFRGRARTYDALDPLSWPSAAVAGPRLVRAATRFSLKNARFFAGYAVDARRVPLAWTPPGRVFVGIEVTSGALLDLTGGIVAGKWGEWAGRARHTGGRTSSRRRAAGRALDLRVPRSVRSLVGNRGEGALALHPEPTVVVPVRWRRVAREGAYEATLPTTFLELAGGRSGRSFRANGVAALTVDRLASWRAAEMAGMLLQGQAEAPSQEDGVALVRLRPRRVVWWEGWSSGSVSERDARGAG